MAASIPHNTARVTPNFQCPVCFDELAPADTMTLEACAHVCCRKCLRQHVTLKIASAQISPTCFYALSHTGQHSLLCPGVVFEAEIERLVDVKTLTLYRRFQFNAQHPVFGRQCPHCDHSQVFPQGDQQPECVCVSCGQSFCFFHADAHIGRTCAQYGTAIKKAERVTTTAIEKTTKRCPGCLVTIEKNVRRFVLLAVPDAGRADLFPRALWLVHGCGGLPSAWSLWGHRVGRLAVQGLVVIAVVIAVGVPALTLTAVLTVATLGWYPLRKRYSAWGACKVCFFVTALFLFNALYHVRQTVGARVRGLWSRWARRWQL